MTWLFRQWAPWWTLLLFAAVLLIGLAPFSRRVVRAISAGLAWLGARSVAGECFVGLFSLLLGSVPPMFGWNQLPMVHDEIAYLFQGETFARGRLTNPTPPVWEAFQTFHELMVPTYASKFPPGQGLTLAAGMLLGSPRIGTIVTIALACAGICWMARACVPARWAIVCGLLAAVHPVVLEWSQIYWGGGLSMLGAAMFLGAAIRLARDMASSPPSTRRHATHGAIAAAGLAILAISRPFEGLLLALLVGAWLFMRAIRRGRFVHLLRFAGPAGLAVLLPAAMWLGYYNYRVTGSPWTMPYLVHSKQYMRAPLLRWQALNDATAPPVLHITNFHQIVEFNEYQQQRTLAGFGEHLKGKAWVLAELVRPILPALALVLGIGVILRRPLARFCAITIICFVIAHVLCTPWSRLQYFGPIMPLYFALLTMCLQRLRWRRISFGNQMSLASLITWLVIAVMIRCLSARDPATFAIARQDIVRTLEQMPGNHIVAVLYLAGKQRLFEWVHNSPDIASQRVIFVHAIDNPTLMRVNQAFPNRRLWLLQVQGLSYQVNELTPVTSDSPSRAP